MGTAFLLGVLAPVALLGALLLELLLERIRRRGRLDRLAHASRAFTIGALGGSVAHELSQPLAAILSNTQAALRLLSADPPQVDLVREILVDIASDDQRAAEIIRRMRRMLQQGEPERVALDVNDVVREAVRLLADEALLRKVRIAVEPQQPLPRIHGDPVQLQQVLLNLLMNAFDAMEAVAAEERRLLLRTSRCGRDLVEIVVADHGPGVERHKLERIFEPFYTTKRTGMGIGLYITRAIVQAHGGRIEAAANGDRGLQVRVALPAGRMKEAS
jgi:signal transduction histidine kinase